MIWLIGEKGMLGTELAKLLSNAGKPWVGTDREVDITSMKELSSFAGEREIRWIVNCAAYTAVDRAEDEVDLCYRLNRNGPANIGRLASQIGARVIHLSTDYVFDGSASRPYHEEDPVSPVGVYGRSKAEGETALLAECPQSFVIRTAWLYGSSGSNFVLTMLRMMREKSEIGVVADKKGSPTYAGDLAGMIALIVSVDSDLFGIYNYTNLGEVSWFDFASEIHLLARSRGLIVRDCAIKPISSEQYKTKAARPHYSVLSKDKIMRVFGVQVPYWKNSLMRFIEILAA